MEPLFVIGPGDAPVEYLPSMRGNSLLTIGEGTRIASTIIHPEAASSVPLRTSHSDGIHRILTGDSAQCINNIECYDGNICTINTCTSGQCVTEYVDGCSTSSHELQERSTPYSYLSALSTNTSHRQQEFVDFITARGQLMGEYTPGSIYMTSDTDGGDDTIIDIPAEQQFNYFGTKMTQMSVSPQGVLSLPPIPYCSSTTHEIVVSILCLRFLIILYTLYSTLCCIHL